MDAVTHDRTAGHFRTCPDLSASGEQGGLTGDRLGVNCAAGQLPTCPPSPPPADQAPPRALQSFDFDFPPDLGTVVMFHGQRYVMAGMGTITRRDGPDLEAALWETHCARCGGPFIAKMTLIASGGTRRCEVCRTVERGRV